MSQEDIVTNMGWKRFGRKSIPGDRRTGRDACVVNQLFLDTYNLSIGDKIHVELGDRLFHQDFDMGGALAGDAESLSNFTDTAELEIIGAWQDAEDDSGAQMFESQWRYTKNTIFVPRALLPVEVPADHEPCVGEFSVFIENARDIEAFQEAAEPVAAIQVTRHKILELLQAKE